MILELEGVGEVYCPQSVLNPRPYLTSISQTFYYCDMYVCS